MELLHSKIYSEELTTTPVLVFHGLFGMLDNWGNFAREFSAKFPVHLLDLRNHGKSFHSPEMSHEAMALDILHYMDQKGIEKAILLGHSLGGKAVMHFALSYPDRVEKLVVVDMAPKSYPPHHQAIIHALQSIKFEQDLGRKDVETKLVAQGLDLSNVQFLAKSLFWKEPGLLDWRFNLEVLAAQYEDFVGAAIKTGVYHGPTLFVRGGKSQYVLDEDRILLSQQFPSYQLETVPGAGHWVHAENPKAFHEIVHDFLLGTLEG